MRVYALAVAALVFGLVIALFLLACQAMRVGLS